MTEIDNMGTLINAIRGGAASQAIVDIGRFRHIIVPGPTGGVLQKIDLQDGLAAPLRKFGKIVVFDAASLNQIIADNSDAGNVAVYLDRNPDAPSVVAVLNGNGKSGAGWGDFRASIQFRPTPQWTKWKSRDGKMSPQADFAEFIEDNIEDIAEPAGATMLEIATYLETTRTLSFRSGVRLSSGAVQFQHIQDDVAKVGASTIDVPEAFELGIAPIFGLPSYRVPARFRWRLLPDGKLTLGFKLQRIETMMSQIVEDVCAKIERGTNVSVIDGLAPP